MLYVLDDEGRIFDIGTHDKVYRNKENVQLQVWAAIVFRITSW